MIPIVAIFAVIVLPLGIGLVAILTEHQRKMAEIIHRNRGSDEGQKLQALEQRVAELTELVHQQTIAIDSLSTHSISSNARIESRLNGGA